MRMIYRPWRVGGRWRPTSMPRGLHDPLDQLRRASCGCARPSEFGFRVGEAEVHIVRFSFSQVWGTVRIWVDDRVVKRDLRLLSLSRFKDYRLVVGNAERHEVLIRKERPWVAAGFRQQVCHVFIDGKAAGDYASQPVGGRIAIDTR